MKLLSIIVPMYNVEQYLERCLLSLEYQDISKDAFEIICINDGSPDRCGEIVKTLQEDYSNIILINQENQGVSIARNNGIETATGKYLLMIDPDDYVVSNSLNNIIEKTDRCEAQVSFLGYRFLGSDNGSSLDIIYEKLSGQVFSGIEACNLSRIDGRIDPDRTWAILFNTAFIKNNNLRYLPGVPYLEDGELIVRILSLAERCIFDDRLFYMRTTRTGSATNSMLFFSKKSTDGFIKAALNLKHFRDEQDFDIKHKIFLNQPVVKFVVLAVNSSINHGSFGRLLYCSKVFCKNGLKKCDLTGCNKTYKTYGKAYNLSIIFCAFLLKVLPAMSKFKRLFHNNVK